ncbi:MAG: hypothetical protein GVY35_11860, partial [Bacteroidetes bacterium]|nr:hypothetical protein [Bacteroidota bacterium]
RAGYDLLGYFVLPPTNWIDNYYEPTAERIPAFLERHAGCPEAEEIVAMERQEADLYRHYQDWFSYGFYIARKRCADVVLRSGFRMEGGEGQVETGPYGA